MADAEAFKTCDTDTEHLALQKRLTSTCKELLHEHNGASALYSSGTDETLKFQAVARDVSNCFMKGVALEKEE